MANYMAEGNKIVRCTSGKDITIPLNSTGFLCPNGCTDCNQYHIVLVSYFGTIVDKDGNCVY